jgi:hypothetical protein
MLPAPVAGAPPGGDVFPAAFSGIPTAWKHTSIRVRHTLMLINNHLLIEKVFMHFYKFNDLFFICCDSMKQ